MLEKLLLFDNVDRCQRSGAGHRVATICTTMTADRPLAHQLFSGDDSRHRESTGNALRHDHDVRLNIPMLAGEPLRRTTESTLHFIEDEQNSMLIAEPAQALEIPIVFVVAGRGHYVSALAEHRFHNNGCHRMRFHLMVKY